MKKGDRAMLLLFTALAAAAFFLYRSVSAPPRQKTVLVTVDGQVVDTFQIDENMEPFERTYKAGGGLNTVRAEGGAVSVISADCPDQLCVRQGKLHRPGDTSVCLPNRLLIRVAGEAEKSDLDGGTY